jgi:NAD(P)-dependent dehydrogenase (short-subunit alcohol dehydrogenase family)
MLREHHGNTSEGEAKIRRRISRVPLGTILKPEDLARAALYLVSSDSEGVTGITHIVDGGLLAAAEYDVPL